MTDEPDVVTIPLDEVMRGLSVTLPRGAWEGLVAYGRECVAAKLEGKEPPSPDPNMTYKEWLASVEKCKADYEQRARG